MKYFDTHCHLNANFFKESIESAIKIANENCVTHILLPGVNVEDIKMGIKLSKKYKNVFAAAGIHPSESDKEDISYLNSINPNEIKAIGEVGIDLYHDNNPPLDVQIKCFEKHIQFAQKHNKPLIIHMRNSEKEVYEIIKKYENVKFLMHSFTSSLEWANKFIELGGYISFSGIVTFKNAKNVQEVASKININRIICETDAPFLTPEPHRGKQNFPVYVKHVVDFIANIRKEKNVEETIFNTSKNFFNI